MIYRRFGRTGLAMPALSFGCMRSMHSWQDTPLAGIPGGAQENLEAIFRQALAQGINHVETAQGYGSSERQLGGILPKFERRTYLLQTKVAPCEDPAVFLEKVSQSMHRLRVDRLDLLALHGINDYRSLWYSCRQNGCLAAARRLQDRGVVDHVGFSGHGPCEVILQALEHEEDGGFDFVNLHWYFIFDANRRAVECAAARDLGVFIISPSDKGGHLHTPAPLMVRLCSPLSPMLFNDLYCLRQAGVATISVGASAPDQFAEHLKTLPLLESGDFKSVDLIASRLGEAMRIKTGFDRPDALWDRLPAWEGAPGNINIRMVLWLDNLYRGWGLTGYARDRYAMLGSGSAWVPGNNAAGADHLDFSPLAADAPVQPDELVRLLRGAHERLKKESGRR